MALQAPSLVGKLVLASISHTPEGLHPGHRNERGWPAEVLRSIAAPVLVVIGDSDIVRPEHAVEIFRLFGGGVMGDGPAGLPASQLAVLPGTSHIGIAHQAELLAPMIVSFLDR
jgi:pimeloyl-ACP methyl ester carboxylesterase